jgi:hypothetical protein
VFQQGRKIGFLMAMSFSRPISGVRTLARTMAARM